MKDKKYKKKYGSKASKKNKNINRSQDYKWIIKITSLAFIITLFMSTVAELALEDINIFLSFIIVIIFIILGIIFDMIGIAVTVADQKVFHSMSAKRVKGAKTAIKLMNNASKVSSFCNDVIGDICGILSGTSAATIAISLSLRINLSPLIITLLVTSFIAALTIGGKALGKSIAINSSNNILFRFAKVISIFVREK